MKLEKIDSILETARKLFAKYGLKKTSLDEVAKIARVAKGTIYNYFGSKDKVYHEVLRREVAEILNNISFVVDGKTTPVEKLEGFVKAKFFYMKKAINILNLDRKGLEMILPDAEIIRSEYFKKEINIIYMILKNGVDKGTFYINNLDFAALAIGHAFRGFELNWLVDESKEDIECYLSELLNIIFGGIISKKNKELN